MVQFGKRFETSQTRRWSRHNADYERLKLLINLVGAAREREGPETTVGLTNFGRSEDGGLLESDVQLCEGVFEPSEALEKNALETLWRKNRKRGPLAKSTSLSNLERFAFGTVHSPKGDDLEDDAWHWSRWLFSSRLPRSYALLAHGFDVALVAELDKVDALYARELRVLKSRWQDAIQDDFEEAETEDESLTFKRKASYAAVDVEDPSPVQQTDSAQSTPARPLDVADAATRASLKRSLAQLDADARELIDFTVWNFTAFTKITKKRDKRLKREPPIRERFTNLVKNRDCCAATSARKLIKDVHRRYADLFCGGSTTEAELELREAARAANETAQALYGGQPTMATLRFGYRAGVAATLAVWVMWDCVEVVNSVHKKVSHDSVAAKAAWPLFRACGVLLAWHWLWGLSLWVWNRFRVNQAFLFDVVDTASSPAASAADVFDECILETNVLLSLLLCYYKSTYRGGMPKFIEKDGYIATTLPQAIPLLLVAFLLKCLVHPWSRRKQLWRILGRVVRAPFCEVRFVDTYVADVLTSMVKVLLDALWCGYFFTSGSFLQAQSDRKDLEMQLKTHAFWYKQVLAPAVCFFPIWFRFAQCLRKYVDVGDGSGRSVHLGNAAKYAFSAIVTITTLIHGAENLRSRWSILFFGSSIFSWAWDVHVDWGLHFVASEEGEDTSFKRRHSSSGLEKRRWHILSRQTRMYPKKWWYRGAAVLDLFGRFVWLATLVPPNAFGSRFHSYIPDYLTPILALAELARRCVWGFFRLENEHLSNAFQHRREGQFVPSHLRTLRPRKAPKRVLSVVETGFIAALVIALVSRMTILAHDSDRLAHLGNATAPRAYPNHTVNPLHDMDDDTFVAHHHHHHKHKIHADDDDVAESDDWHAVAVDDAKKKKASGTVDGGAPTAKKTSGKNKVVVEQDDDDDG